VVVQDSKIVHRLTPSESFDAVHSGKDTVSASFRFKQPGREVKYRYTQPSVEEYNWKDGCRGGRYLRLRELMEFNEIFAITFI